MRHRSARALVAAVALAGAALAACSDDGDPRASTTTTEEPATIAPDDPVLTQRLLTAGDLPDGFTASEPVDDTITSFCAGQDATAGLSAQGRAITAFTRTPAGASVIEIVFRFHDDGATRFVEQAEELLTSCHEVPDASGLAFTYEPVGPAVSDALAGADSSASRHGRSVGSGDLTIDVAVVQVGDLGALIAALGVEVPRDELDALAIDAFAAAVERLGE